MLVSVDTLRADRLGCYGWKGAQTPHIDALAAAGSAFDDVTAAAPITAPSHATIFTGLYPPEHGVRTNGFYRLPEVETLATRFRSAGFRTGAVIGAFPLDSRFGFARGFDVYDERFGTAMDGEAERPAAAVADAACKFLEEMPADRRFFLFLHFYDPHADYTPPPAFATLHPYDGEIAYVDRELGRVLQTLDRRGLAAKTAVALVSDHGESLGEHGEPTHAVFVYQSTLRVPFILRLPGAAAGKRVAEPVSLCDVAPTLLDVMGLHAASRTSGTSLVPLLGRKRSLAPRALYFESLMPEVEFGWSPLHGVRLGSVKVIDAPRRESYRLDQDPGESRNLWSLQGGIDAAAWRELQARRASWPKSVAAPAAIDLESARKLEALGYLAGAGRTTAAATAADPKDRIALLLPMVEGLRHFKEGAHAEAEASYEKALQVDPANPVLQKNLARAVAAQGRLEEAERFLASAIGGSSGPMRSDLLDLKASYAIARGDAAAAAIDARLALELDPAHERAALTLAAALEKDGKGSEAAPVLERAAAQHPQRAAALVALAEMSIRAGRADLAKAKLADALAREPGHGRAHYDLGSLLLQEGNTEASVEHLRKAHAVLPSEEEVARQLAQALAELGRLEEAAAVLERSSQLESRYRRAVILSRAGRLEQAIELLEALSSEHASEGKIWNALGSAHGRRRDMESAVECFRKAVALDPGAASYRENLAQAEAARGR